ncbi:hypothetical protein TNCV_2566641 [Trichonephila clavipes]|uniref:Uncharacterized protein n=1 Tax=Trichonephila clavipes TaxID=2585209 RepID=A0A8X6WLI7_TRICX|nr:hypothetical protein TNCV_2566641 [Trichonephila clavipes]
MADCEVGGTTRYCKPPSIPYQVASKENERAMTPTEEAAREEIENAREADAPHRHSKSAGRNLRTGGPRVGHSCYRAWDDLAKAILTRKPPSLHTLRTFQGLKADLLKERGLIGIGTH